MAMHSFSQPMKEAHIKINNITVYILPKNLLPSITIGSNEIRNHPRVIICEIKKEEIISYFENNLSLNKSFEIRRSEIDIRLLIVIKYNNDSEMEAALSGTGLLSVDKEFTHKLEYNEIIKELESCSLGKYGW